MRYFTSDWHLGSSNINMYAKRPFVSAGDAAKKLVDACNETAHWKTDVVFHVGDFWLKNTDRHGEVEDANVLTADVKEYLNFIYASFILLEGNHDTRNCESDLKSMYVDLNHNYRNIYVSHFPSYHQFYRGPSRFNEHGLKIVLCGHVHEKWLFMYDWKKNVLNVNVGVDQWFYKPVSDVQLTELLDYLKAYLFTKFTLREDFSMDREHFDLFVKAKTIEVKEARIKRHAEKLKKKGLTPEECERRKLEAMKAKGLI